jgi:uncharacterized protein
MLTGLLQGIADDVSSLFKEKQVPELTFHNIDHTRLVVQGVLDIGVQSGLTAEELETVSISAWFHDTGYFYRYAGHEDESIRLAQMYLKEQNLKEARIRQVSGCIAATKYPQNPQNLLEQVLCDADLYHLTMPGYPVLANKLRMEWSFFLNKIYTDAEWEQENCEMLKKHTYHTAFGRDLLQSLKERNLKRIMNSCD